MAEEIWFTADTHFNHRNILLFRKSFSSVEEMNESMIAGWNDRVAKCDRVYHLGDVALGSGEKTREILDRLNGRIYLIRGNHEAVAEHRTCRDRFEGIWDLKHIKIAEQKIVLCHYAMRTWNCSHYGAWQLHGHSHGTLPELEDYCQMDVGVDPRGFRPVSFEEVRLVMATKTFKPVDHHTSECFAESETR